MFSLETSFQVFSLEIPISEKTFTWNRQRIEYQEQGFSILCQTGSVFGLHSFFFFYKNEVYKKDRLEMS